MVELHFLSKTKVGNPTSYFRNLMTQIELLDTTHWYQREVHSRMWKPVFFPRKGHHYHSWQSWTRSCNGMPQVGLEAVGSVYEDSQAGLGLQAPTLYHQFWHFQGREDASAIGGSQGTQRITVIYYYITNNIVIVSGLCPESLLFPLFSPPQHMLAVLGLLLPHISKVKRKTVLINVR